jgi:hypothetical protein
MRKLFSVLAASLMGAMSFGAPTLARRPDPAPLPLFASPSSKGKGHGKPARRAKKTGRPWASGKHYPSSSARQNRPKYRTAVVNGFPIMQRLGRRDVVAEQRLAA